MCTYSLCVWVFAGRVYAFRMIRLCFFWRGQVCVRLQLYWTKGQALSQWDECVCSFWGSLTYYSTNKLTILQYQLVNNECLLHKFSLFKCAVCVVCMCANVCGLNFVILLLIKCTMYDQFYVAALRSQRWVMLFDLNKENSLFFYQRQKFVRNAIFWVISSRIFAFFICTIYIFIYTYI